MLYHINVDFVYCFVYTVFTQMFTFILQSVCHSSINNRPTGCCAAILFGILSVYCTCITTDQIPMSSFFLFMELFFNPALVKMHLHNVLYYIYYVYIIFKEKLYFELQVYNYKFFFNHNYCFVLINFFTIVKFINSFYLIANM